MSHAGSAHDSRLRDDNAVTFRGETYALERGIQIN